MEYRIYGEIVDIEAQKCSPEDICPADFSEFAQTLSDNSELDVHFNSCGGSCYAGFAIANTIKSLKQRGIKTTAYIDGIAASIATVIVCACDEIIFPKASFLMIHNCWGSVIGNSSDLRKEADVMDQMNKTIMSYYKGKFDLEESEIKQMMDNETWISGADAEKFKLHCTVVDSDAEFNIAAKLDKNFKNFKHIPEAIMEHLDKAEVKEVEETEVEEKEEAQPKVEEMKEDSAGCTEEKKAEEVVEETKEDTSEEMTEEKTSDEETTEEETTDDDDEEEKITVKACEKRVSGMQSTMQNKINALTASYEDKITQFKNEIKAKDEELSKLKDELTSLKTKLEASTEELSKTASALEDKTNKLAALNAGVLAEREVIDWRNLHGKAFFDYLKKNNIR